MSKYRMDEATAKMLAAELQSHRYWKVLEVYRDPDIRNGGRWIVQIEHRYNQYKHLLVTSEPCRKLAENLNEWGREGVPRDLRQSV